MMEIVEAVEPEAVDAARGLFREYERWLGLDLCFQGFEEELRGLPGKYAAPDGRLLLARVNGEVAGCVAMRPLGDGVCEMKRLYLSDAARGMGLGRRLIEAVLAEARGIGYERMRLDTYPAKMARAVQLYRAYGFREIEAYYDNPYDGVLFMEAEL